MTGRAPLVGRGVVRRDRGGVDEDGGHAELGVVGHLVGEVDGVPGLQDHGVGQVPAHDRAVGEPRPGCRVAGVPGVGAHPGVGHGRHLVAGDAGREDVPHVGTDHVEEVAVGGDGSVGDGDRVLDRVTASDRPVLRERRRDRRGAGDAPGGLLDLDGRGRREREVDLVAQGEDGAVGVLVLQLREVAQQVGRGSGGGVTDDGGEPYLEDASGRDVAAAGAVGAHLPGEHVARHGEVERDGVGPGGRRRAGLVGRPGGQEVGHDGVAGAVVVGEVDAYDEADPVALVEGHQRVGRVEVVAVVARVGAAGVGTRGRHVGLDRLLQGRRVGAEAGAGVVGDLDRSGRRGTGDRVEQRRRADERHLVAVAVTRDRGVLATPAVGTEHPCLERHRGDVGGLEGERGEDDLVAAVDLPGDGVEVGTGRVRARDRVAGRQAARGEVLGARQGAEAVGQQVGQHDAVRVGVLARADGQRPRRDAAGGERPG